jgi:fructose-bisphosphate aldolase, class I
MDSLGKTIRLARLQNPASGRILTIAIDHAPSYGVMKGIEDMKATLEHVASAGPDAVLLMRGTAERCFAPYAGRMALILKCSTLSPLHPEEDVLVTHVEEAMRLGADAVAMAVTVGSPCQPQILRSLAILVREAEQFGIPVIAHAYPNGSLMPAAERFTADRVCYASRLVMELGVDIVKTFYTGSAETFAKVVQVAAPALVVAAGGARLDSRREVLGMAREVVRAKAAGITFGRNVWQDEDVPAVIRELKSIVHGKG